MLEELRIQNYTLIDEATLRFGPGLNVLTGETGAGKSILIDALSLALGDRGRVENVREGADQAEVVALFQTSANDEIAEWTEKYGIEPEDGTLLIRRTLRPNGRGAASVQAVPVTRAALSELANILVDIHGQHEHQSLFDIAMHRMLLDRFAGIADRVKAFTDRFAKLAEVSRRLEALDEEEGRFAREADFLRYAVEEIDAAELKSGEEETLFERQKVLANHEDLAGELEGILDAMSDAREGVLFRLRGARDSLNRASAIDATLEEMTRRFDSVFFELEDATDDIRRRREAGDYDPAELEAVDERLSRISTLKAKHGFNTVHEVLEYAEKTRKQLAGIESREDERRQLLSLKEDLQNQVIAEAKVISDLRQSASGLLREKTEEHLRSLGMENARFIVELEGKHSKQGKTAIGPYGIDDVEFQLSANQGEAPKPLKAVASGGEISRVMLAVKTVLSESDRVQTMVFDEVDSGIGGEVARSVGMHLSDLSRRKQVFCVTHLASIAVFADNHLQVDKHSAEGRTVTRVCQVRGDSRVREVARMLAGDREGVVSLEHAARLLEERGRRDMALETD